MRRVGTIVLLSLIVAACAPSTQPRGGVAPLPPPYDLVISGGRVVGGTGAPRFYGDLASRGGRTGRVAGRGVSAEPSRSAGTGSRGWRPPGCYATHRLGNAWMPAAWSWPRDSLTSRASRAAPSCSATAATGARGPRASPRRSSG